MKYGPVAFWSTVALTAGLLVVSPILGGGAVGDYAVAVAAYLSGSVAGMLSCAKNGKG